MNEEERQQITKKLLDVSSNVLRYLQKLNTDDDYYDDYRTISNNITDACIIMNKLNKLVGT